MYCSVRELMCLCLCRQRLERGENVDDEETFGQGDGDAQDKLSGQLGIELAVKVIIDSLESLGLNSLSRL